MIGTGGEHRRQVTEAEIIETETQKDIALKTFLRVDYVLTVLQTGQRLSSVAPKEMSMMS